MAIRKWKKKSKTEKYLEKFKQPTEMFLWSTCALCWVQKSSTKQTCTFSSMNCWNLWAKKTFARICFFTLSCNRSRTLNFPIVQCKKTHKLKTVLLCIATVLRISSATWEATRCEISIKILIFFNHSKWNSATTGNYCRSRSSCYTNLKS